MICLVADVDENKNQYQNCDLDEIIKNRILSESDNCIVLGIQNKKLFEMEHSTKEFFIHRVKDLRNYKTYEIEVI